MGFVQLLLLLWVDCTPILSSRDTLMLFKKTVEGTEVSDSCLTFIVTGRSWPTLGIDMLNVNDAFGLLRLSVVKRFFPTVISLHCKTIFGSGIP